MVYTCAYFESPDDDLDTAQEQKLDLVCRKLRLREGERLLDIGCGWGALVMHAAEHYGVEALGITLSEPQAELANERIRAAGLEGRCRVDVCDYRDLDAREGFDKVASICMFEQSGRRYSRLLRPRVGFPASRRRLLEPRAWRGTTTSSARPGEGPRSWSGTSSPTAVSSRFRRRCRRPSRRAWRCGTWRAFASTTS